MKRERSCTSGMEGKYTVFCINQVTKICVYFYDIGNGTHDFSVQITFKLQGWSFTLNRTGHLTLLLLLKMLVKSYRYDSFYDVFFS